MTENRPLRAALAGFASTVTTKMSQLTAGEPEDQLRAPFESLMTDTGDALSLSIVSTGETPLPDRLGRPDYAVHVNGPLAGYVELKAPGVGTDTARYTGHNRVQWKRFSAIPNILYCDGNEWALYRSGERVGRVVRIAGDVTTDGPSAVSATDAGEVERLLRDFLAWQPIIPTDRNGKIDLEEFASLLAPLCRMLRDDVVEALKDEGSPLIQLAHDWRQLLFPDASNEQFADAYAQTVTFALLLGRSEGADPLSLDKAEAALAAEHSLLSRALRVLTDPAARVEMAASLDLLLRIIAVVPPSTLTGPTDPWLYFYEDFLAAYDPKLRKAVGAYYTPVEVVHAQVRLVDDLLVNRLGMALGFADPSVVTLDPAVGTGTYLLGIIDHVRARIAAEQGAGAVAGQAAGLAANLYGFELMVGPYAVTELRVSRALRDAGAVMPEDGTHVYLTDTLESPHATPPQLPLILKPIAEQHVKALQVKSSVPVIVCLGNPPYERSEAATGSNQTRTGGWVRWGDSGNGSDAIFRDFLDPAIAAGHGVRVHNLYNFYVYFWRWALWKVFEQAGTRGPGVVTYVSASSYLDGDAFCGMREHVRRQCEAVWILDLGGEGRGTRRTENVFAIQTPVAIAVALGSEATDANTPAIVHYARIDGSREEKLSRLAAVSQLTDIAWEECPTEWQAPFRPSGVGDYFAWPLLIDIMPWQHSGVQLKRTWPIAPEVKTLERRWRALLGAADRSEAFHGTGDREVDGRYRIALTDGSDSTPIAQLRADSPVPPVHRYAYRSFDRQYIIADGRLASRPRPDLWRTSGDRQVYLTTLLNHPLGRGPAATSAAGIPDLHHFRGSYGAKEVIPLYRDSAATEPNVASGLLRLLEQTYGQEVTAEDLAAYVYGTLAQPAFTARFAAALETRELRVPITKDAALFERVRAAGATLLYLHTYAQRFVPQGQQAGRIPTGDARCTKAVSGEVGGYPEAFAYDEETRTLRVGGGEFAPVDPDVYEFEVSGLKVVQSWLGYRMKDGAGRKSSPLDDVRPEHWTSEFTTELLELLWVLEATVAGYPEQAQLLTAVVSGDCLDADGLPDVPPSMRNAPPAAAGDRLFETEGSD
jgi:hypothetical protein